MGDVMAFMRLLGPFSLPVDAHDRTVGTLKTFTGHEYVGKKQSDGSKTCESSPSKRNGTAGVKDGRDKTVGQRTSMRLPREASETQGRPPRRLSKVSGTRGL